MPEITLDPDLTQQIEQHVTSGRFPTASDVVRAGLQLLAQAAERRAEIRADLAARTADNAAFLPADEVFANLRAHHAASQRDA